MSDQPDQEQRVELTSRLHTLFNEAGDVIEKLRTLNCDTTLDVYTFDGQGMTMHDLSGEFRVRVQFVQTIERR